jgi:hypothetical protein
MAAMEDIFLLSVIDSVVEMLLGLICMCLYNMLNLKP